MLECHVYPLDREGKIVGRVDLVARDASEAMHMAREHFPDVALEVWCGTRVVGKLERDEPAPQWRIYKNAE
jgi:hypothetical protein